MFVCIMWGSLLRTFFVHTVLSVARGSARPDMDFLVEYLDMIIMLAASIIASGTSGVLLYIYTSALFNATNQ